MWCCIVKIHLRNVWDVRDKRTNAKQIEYIRRIRVDVCLLSHRFESFCMWITLAWLSAFTKRSPNYVKITAMIFFTRVCSSGSHVPYLLNTVRFKVHNGPFCCYMCRSFYIKMTLFLCIFTFILGNGIAHFSVFNSIFFPSVHLFVCFACLYFVPNKSIQHFAKHAKTPFLAGQFAIYSPSPFTSTINKTN